MSETSEKARSAAKDKAERLVRADPKARVDASGYRPDGAMDADVAMGMRPVSRRAYKHGGKVEGEKTAHRADRKPRKSGGALTAESLINRNVKTANEDRGGITHTGGMKSGGRTHKMVGGGLAPQLGGQRSAMPPARPMMRKDGGKVEHGAKCECAKCSGGRVERKSGGPAINDGTRPVAGRLARKAGGRTKKGTNVNIIISQPPAQGAPPMPMRPPMAPPPGPPGAPVGLHQGAPPAMIPAGAMPVPAPQNMPMQRKSGGRAVDDGKLAKPGAYPIKDGAGGGLGRLEKAKAYGA